MQLSKLINGGRVRLRVIDFSTFSQFNIAYLCPGVRQFHKGSSDYVHFLISPTTPVGFKLLA